MTDSELPNDTEPADWNGAGTALVDLSQVLECLSVAPDGLSDDPRVRDGTTGLVYTPSPRLACSRRRCLADRPSFAGFGHRIRASLRTLEWIGSVLHGPRHRRQRVIVERGLRVLGCHACSPLVRVSTGLYASVRLRVGLSRSLGSGAEAPDTESEKTINDAVAEDEHNAVVAVVGFWPAKCRA